MTKQHERPSIQSTLDLLATVLMAIAALSVIAWQARSYWLTSQPPTTAIPLPKNPVSLLGAARSGSESAPVVMVEYADFQCPYCARFTLNDLPMIRSKYVESGVVLLAFRNDPLSIHTLARKAAEAAVCAGEQRAFWPAHDLLFASQDQLEAAVGRIPMEANLDKSSFEECVRERGATRVQADLDSGSALKVRSTPVFFVGVRESGDVVRVVKVVKGAKPLSEFQTAIEAALQAVPGHRPFSD